MNPDRIKWGCISIVGLAGLVLVFNFICQPSDPIKAGPGQKGITSYLLDHQGSLMPGEQQDLTVTLEPGKVCGELYGFSTMFSIKVQSVADNSIVPYAVVSDKQTYARLQWDIPRAGAYVVYITNITSDTKSDYILKMWKGSWKEK